MFNNIGGKLKVVAQVYCWIGIVASVIGSIALFSNNSRYSPTIIPGIIVLIVGCLMSYISSLPLYGFGQLIQNSDRQNELESVASKERKDILNQLQSMK